MTVRLAITVSLEDFIAANLLYLRRYWIWSGLLKIFAFTTPAYFLLTLAVSSFYDPFSWQLALFWLQVSLWFGLGMVVFVPAVTWVVMRTSVRRQFEQLSMGLPVEYEIDANGLRAASEQGTTSLTWDLFCDFVQDRRVLLLRRSRRVFFVLPRAQLDDEQLEEILTCLREAGVKEG